MSAPLPRRGPAALLVLSALLAAGPARALPEEPSAAELSVEVKPVEAPPPEAPPPEPPRALELGLEARLLFLRRAPEFEGENPFVLGGAAFARRGWLHVALSADAQDDVDSDFGWRRPGETRVTRRHTTLSAEVGVTIPGTTIGRRWFWRHVGLDVLAVGGVERILVREDLGGGGVGNQGWRRTVPYLGLRVGPRLRIGRAFGGHVGLSAWWRHPLRQGSIPSATGRSAPATGDAAGVMVFTGGSYAWE